jgi:hypothetical protein
MDWHSIHSYGSMIASHTCFAVSIKCLYPVCIYKVRVQAYAGGERYLDFEDRV